MTRIIAAVILAASAAATGFAAEPPKRKPLDPKQRAAVLALVKAVDLAQTTDVVDTEQVAWDNHVFKSGERIGYVPFTVSIGAPGFKATTMYVRAVSRHDGMRVADERSRLREWLLRGGDVPPRPPQTVSVSVGELPVGGIAATSTRQATAAAAAASGVLAMQQREYEKQKQAIEEAKKRAESPTPEPFLFPFEDYFFFPGGTRVERALALPPGEYDVFTGLIDHDRVKTSSPVVVRRTVTVPDFWSDELRLSSIILAKDVQTLAAPLKPERQVEQPYTFGHAQVVPVASPRFTPQDALAVVYQITNYGAPDSDLTAEYAFYRADGNRRLFNRTLPQQFSDADLPPPNPWSTQAFTMQAVSLNSFPPGDYELEVTVRDRLTRTTATGRVAFTVALR